MYWASAMSWTVWVPKEMERTRKMGSLLSLTEGEKGKQCGFKRTLWLISPPVKEAGELSLIIA